MSLTRFLARVVEEPLVFILLLISKMGNDREELEGLLNLKELGLNSVETFQVFQWENDAKIKKWLLNND